MATLLSGSVNVVTLVYDSLAEEHSGAPTIVLNPASSEPLIYSKVGCTTLEKTVITFLHSKCLPILVYATEACPLLARDLSSLEFTTTRVFMKIFRTSSSAVIAECQRNLNFLSVQRQFTIRTAKFLQAFAASDNQLWSLFESVAVIKLNSILTSFSVKYLT